MKAKIKSWTPLLIGILAGIILIPLTIMTTVKGGVEKIGVVEEAGRLMSPWFVNIVGLLAPVFSRVKPTTVGWLLLIIGGCLLIPGVVFAKVWLAIPSGLLYIIAAGALLLNEKRINKYE